MTCPACGLDVREGVSHLDPPELPEGYRLAVQSTAGRSQQMFGYDLVGPDGLAFTSAYRYRSHKSARLAGIKDARACEAFEAERPR